MPRRYGSLNILAFALLWLSGVSFGQEPAAPTPVPSEARQKEIRGQLDDALGVTKAKTTPQRQQATRGLMEMALDPGVSPDELYVVLHSVLSLVKETGDFESHQLASLKLTETFSVDPKKDRVELLLEFIASGKTASTIKSAVEQLAELATERGFSNQFDEPVQWLVTADRSAKKIRAKASIDLIAATKTSLTDRKSAFESQLRAQGVLKLDTENANANLAVGQWLAVFEDDWAAALPHLAKAGDSKWQVASQAELTAGADADSQLKVADAWYDVSQMAGPGQMIVRRRALDLYSGVEPNLTSPIAKSRVAKRKTELGNLLKAYTAIPRPARPKPVVIAPPAATELPANESLEMREWIKLPDYAISGSWKRDQDNSIVCDNKTFSRLFVPVSISGSYQINMRFVRPRKDPNTVAILMPVKNRMGEACFDAWYGVLSGVQFINGAEVIKGKPGTFEQSKPFESEVEHDFEVIVRESEDTVQIEISMDGTSLVQWTGKAEELSLPGTHAIPLSNGLGLAVWGSEVSVKSWKLRLLPGGRAYRLGDDWTNPLLEVAKEPPAEILANCFDWKGRKYFISVSPMSLPETQALAQRLHGRLLTISSAEEEKMIFAEGRGRNLWMSGWCSSDRQWRDDRNRPLKYFGKWATLEGVRQPANSDGVETQLRILTAESLGWDDIQAGAEGHPCIEWGEE
jgi:hypothetical protein